MEPHKFSLGQVVATPGALEAIANTSGNIVLVSLIRRHGSGDWGELCPEDKKLNDWAVESGEDRIMSSYKLSNGKVVWLITEWDRSVTTVLLPEEY